MSYLRSHGLVDRSPPIETCLVSYNAGTEASMAREKEKTSAADGSRKPRILARQRETFGDGARSNVPNVVLGRLLLDNSLVERRAAGLLSRVRGQGAAGSDGRSCLVDERIFIERGHRGVGNLECKVS